MGTYEKRPTKFIVDRKNGLENRFLQSFYFVFSTHPYNLLQALHNIEVTEVTEVTKGILIPIMLEVTRGNQR